MISLEKAKALAKVLPWKPKRGDTYWHRNNRRVIYLQTERTLSASMQR